LPYYAIVIVPTELNYQQSIVSVMKAISELFSLGYEVYYSLEPFTLKVKETIISSSYKWFSRCFGINTLIIPISESEDLDLILQVAEKHGVNMAYSHERLWIKGRKLKFLCIGKFKNVPKNVTETVLSMGFNVSPDKDYPNISTLNNFLVFSYNNNEIFRKYFYLEEKVSVENIYVKKPWHTLVYGVNFNKVYEKLLGTRIQLHKCHNRYLEPLVLANNEYPLLIEDISNNAVFLYLHFQAGSHTEKLLANILLYMSSTQVRLHL